MFTRVWVDLNRRFQKVFFPYPEYTTQTEYEKESGVPTWKHSCVRWPIDMREDAVVSHVKSFLRPLADTRVERTQYSKAFARVFSGHLNEDVICASYIRTMTSVVVSTPCYWHRNQGTHKSVVAKVQLSHDHCFGRPIMLGEPRRLWWIYFVYN